MIVVSGRRLMNNLAKNLYEKDKEGHNKSLSNLNSAFRI